MSELSIELVFSMMNSEREFPISLDDAWQWLGYSRKDNAKNTLVNNFERGIDYIIQTPEYSGDDRRQGFSAFNKQDIYLTVDCFKAFGMLAGTAKGKEVRAYFLNCEKKLKELLKAQTIEQKSNSKLLKAETRKKHRATYGIRKTVLKEHGVQPISQGHITRQDYKILLDKDTKELREEYNLSKTDLIIDHLPTADQATLSFGHVMQVESLEAKELQGYYPVKSECADIMRSVAEFRKKLRESAANTINNQEFNVLPTDTTLEA
jgi:phage anti-repressor protein